MADIENFITTILFFIGLLITLLLPLPIKEEYRLFIITMIIIGFLYTILYKFNNKIERQNENIDSLNKRFKTMEELNNIKLDIREIQKKVFKNG